jgi:hypothetical protein
MGRRDRERRLSRQIRRTLYFFLSDVINLGGGAFTVGMDGALHFIPCGVGGKIDTMGYNIGIRRESVTG